MRPPAWAQKVVTRVTGQASDVARDMVWLQRIPRAVSPDDTSSLLGTHIAINKKECPFTFLARLAGPDTVRLDHGVMSGSIPDAVYTRDPVLTRRVLQNKANRRTTAWYRFHHRVFAYKAPRDLLTYSDADDPNVSTLRKAYIAALSETFERRETEIVAHIERWTNATHGPVEMVRATRTLVAELAHMIGFGELPSNRLWVMGYRHPEPAMAEAKRHLAHLIWPVLDRLPMPYAVMHRSRAAVLRILSAYYFHQYRHSDRPDTLLASLRRSGAAEGEPDFAWRALPYILTAASVILPFPMVMTLSVLAEHPEVQERVVREGLYTAALKESLRLYPAVPTIARVISEHLESESAVLEPMASPAGSLYMSPIALLRDPRGWSRPDEFVIDRWLPGWTDDRDADYRLYIPFGLGARSCVGAAFATKLLETFLRVVLPRRIVSNPSGQQPRWREGSINFVRRPCMLHFAERSPAVSTSGGS